MFLLLSAIVCVLAWFYFLLFHGQFWNVRQLGAQEPPSTEVRGPIAVVIPARNEAENIGSAIQSLLRQRCSDVIHIFIVDDNSTDGTAEIARTAAQTAGDIDQVCVVSGRPLEAGWTGKLWAVKQGIEQALKMQPRFLLLTDADIEHGPDNVATLVSIAERQRFDVVSFMVKLHCRSIAERLLIPAFVFFFFMLYPPRWIRSQRWQTAGAAGGCVLIRPEALEHAGGIVAIRQEIIDDCALARAVKKSGGHVWLGLTSDTKSLREYNTFGEVEEMISRTAFNQLHHSIAILTAAILGLTLIYLLPFALLFSGERRLMLAGVAAYLLMFTAYLPMVRFYGLNSAWTAALPFSALFYMTATMHSAVKYWTGRGGQWKGRAQDRGIAS